MDNHIKNRRWRTSTGFVFWGTIIQTVFSLIGFMVLLYLSNNVIDIIIGGIMPSVPSMNLDYNEDTLMGFIGACTICFVVAFFGYIFYLIGICIFKGAQRSEDSATRVAYIIAAELILPVLTVLFNVVYFKMPELFIKAVDHPVAIVVALCALTLTAVIMLLVEFNHLSKEDTWSDRARKGAGNLKFSYSCILYMLGVLIIGVVFIALVIYSTYTKLQTLSYDSYGIGGALQGISSLSQEVQNLTGSIKAIMMLVNLFMLIFAVLNTVYRIIGWNKIQTGGNKEEYHHSPCLNEQGGGRRFCHKCGTLLPEGSVFCPGCGAQVVMDVVSESSVESSELHVAEEDKASDGEVSTELNRSENTLSDSAEECENTETDNRKKWMSWGGIAVGVIAVAVVLWTLWGRTDKMEPNAKVFVNTTGVYKSVMDGKGDILFAELAYNTSLHNIADTKQDDIWTEVMFEDNGKIQRGFINKHDMMNLEDFAMLDAAGFDDEQVRNQVTERMHRLAVLHAVKSLYGEWEMEKPDYPEMYANAKYVLVRKVSPSEQCFAFALEKKDGKDERKVFVYSTPDIFGEGNHREPVYLYNEDIPIEQGMIYDVKYNNKKKRYDVSYLMRYGYCGDDEGEIVSYVEEYPAMYAGPIVLHGQIDGKYDISMTLYENNSYIVTGSYRYLKNDIPIDLTGKFSNDDAVSKRLEQNLVVDEYVDGKCTGSFIGRFNGSSFTGKWVSADGNKEMPFSMRCQ